MGGTILEVAGMIICAQGVASCWPVFVEVVPAFVVNGTTLTACFEAIDWIGLQTADPDFLTTVGFMTLTVGL